MGNLQETGLSPQIPQKTARPIYIMWTPPLSVLFRIFLPQTACASICCIVNKPLVPAYPCLTDIEITSAFFMMQVQLCLALDILYMFSPDSQHVLHTFLWNSSMFFSACLLSQECFFSCCPQFSALLWVTGLPRLFYLSLSLSYSGCLLWEDW